MRAQTKPVLDCFWEQLYHFDRKDEARYEPI
jgi:hypothetical protein